jgi:hypothetical protein
MIINPQKKRFAAWDALEKAGIPLELPEYRVGLKSDGGLTIRQMPTDYIEAVIRELKHCVAYVMPVFIRRDEPGRTIIRDWTLHVPWDDSVDWLVQEKKRNRRWYTFSQNSLHNHHYARKSVLNHCMERVLSRGDIREGLLLAVGKVRPPKTYRNGEIIPIRFSILDQWDYEWSVTFRLPLVRGHLNNEMPSSKRGPLLSRPDYLVPVEELEETGAAKSAKEEKQLCIEK